jgi:hypothetical protein
VARDVACCLVLIVRTTSPLLPAHMLLVVGMTRNYCKSRELRATKNCNEELRNSLTIVESQAR